MQYLKKCNGNISGNYYALALGDEFYAIRIPDVNSLHHRIVIIFIFFELINKIRQYIKEWKLFSRNSPQNHR